MEQCTCLDAKRRSLDSCILYGPWGFKRCRARWTSSMEIPVLPSNNFPTPRKCHRFVPHLVLLCIILSAEFLIQPIAWRPRPSRFISFDRPRHRTSILYLVLPARLSLARLLAMKVVATLVSTILCCSTFVAGKADHKADHKEIARHLQKRFSGHATYYVVGMVSTPGRGSCRAGVLCFGA